MLEINGSLFIIIFGTILHYVFDWSNKNKIIGYFVPVNESIWEHLKLVILPSFIWLIVEYHFYCDNPNLLFAKFIEIMFIMIFIPTIFYIYVYFLKKNVFYIDIFIFIISIIIGQFIFSNILEYNQINNTLAHIGIVGLIMIFLMYITLTYTPIKNILFKDPITNKYGLSNKDV